MTPYVKKFVSEDDLGIFLNIRGVVEKLPDIHIGDGRYDAVSCHMLVRAIEPFFPVSVCDGCFCERYEHSWLLTASGHIIDVYPVAILGGPILVDGVTYSSPSRRLYKEDKDRYGERFSRPEFENGVKLLKFEVGKILSTPGLC
jgi:hypothetical protein